MSKVIYDLTIKDENFNSSIDSWSFTKPLVTDNNAGGTINVYKEKPSSRWLFLMRPATFRELTITNRFYRNPKRIIAMTDFHSLTLFNVTVSNYQIVGSEVAGYSVNFDFNSKKFSHEISIPEILFQIIQ